MKHDWGVPEIYVNCHIDYMKIILCNVAYYVPQIFKQNKYYHILYHYTLTNMRSPRVWRLAENRNLVESILSSFYEANSKKAYDKLYWNVTVRKHKHNN